MSLDPNRAAVHLRFWRDALEALLEAVAQLPEGPSSARARCCNRHQALLLELVLWLDGTFHAPLALSYEEIAWLTPSLREVQRVVAIDPATVSNSRWMMMLDAAISALLDPENPPAVLVRQHREGGRDVGPSQGLPGDLVEGPTHVTVPLTVFAAGPQEYSNVFRGFPAI